MGGTNVYLSWVLVVGIISSCGLMLEISGESSNRRSPKSKLDPFLGSAGGSVNKPGKFLDSEEAEELSHLHLDDVHGQAISQSIQVHQDSPQQCEPIRIALCQGIGYNQTMASTSSATYPATHHVTVPGSDEGAPHHIVDHVLGYQGQDDAETLLQTFTPLIQYGCSPHLKLFLCSSYVPMCSDKVPVPIGPCRSLCESVKSDCEPVLIEFGFTWPISLNCSKFLPENTHDAMCNPGPEPNQGSPIQISGHFDSESGKNIKILFGGGSQPAPTLRIPISKLPKNPIVHPTQIPESIPQSTPPPSSSVISSVDKQELCLKSGWRTSERVWLREQCWIKCPEKHFRRNPRRNETEKFLYFGNKFVLDLQKRSSTEELPPDPFYIMIIRRFVLLSSSGAFFCGIFTVVSFAYFVFCSRGLVLPLKRFNNELKGSLHERPIFYISLCQLLHSVGLIIASASAFYFGSPAGFTQSSISCFVDRSSGLELLARESHLPGLCSLVFILTYFFGMASGIWYVGLTWDWLILSLNLYKLRNNKGAYFEPKARRKVRESSMGHFISWGIASLFTSMALVFKKVDADEYTGLCGVGYQDGETLRYYILYPLAICLGFGAGFFFCGLIFQFQIFPISSIFTRTKKAGTLNLLTSAPSSHSVLTNNGEGPVETHLLLSANHHHHNHFAMDVNFLSPTTLSTTSEGNNCLECLREQAAALRQPHPIPSNPFFDSPTSPLDQRRRNSEVEVSLRKIRRKIGIFIALHILPIAIHICTLSLFSSEEWLSQMLRSGSLLTITILSILRISMSILPAFTTCLWVLITHYEDFKRLATSQGSRPSFNRMGTGSGFMSTDSGTTPTFANSSLRLKTVRPSVNSGSAYNSNNTQSHNPAKTDANSSSGIQTQPFPVFLSSFKSGPIAHNPRHHSELSSRHFKKPKPLKINMISPPSLPLPSIPGSQIDFPFGESDSSSNMVTGGGWRRGETIV